MIKLYYSPGKANLAPHMVLEELAIPYELVLVDTDNNEHRGGDYLRLNPSGRIPALVDGEFVLFETAAICLHLADAYLHENLAPPIGTVARAHLYKWLMYFTNTLQTELITYFYSDRLCETVDAAAQVKRKAEERVSAMLDILEAALEVRVKQGAGNYFLGETYTILDPYLLMLCRWTRGMQRPARSLPRLGKYLRGLLERPAIQRVFAAEGIVDPLI